MLHGLLQVEIHHYVREIYLSCPTATSTLFVGRGAEVHLHPATLALQHIVQRLLPLHVVLVAAVLVHMVCLVVDDHQVRQIVQVFRLGAAQVASVEHVEGVAAGNARPQRQQLVHQLFLVVLFLQEQVPVGDGYQPLAGCLATYALLFADSVGLHKVEHLFSVLWRQKQLLVFLQV